MDKPDPKRILFVDDEPAILQLIQAIFRASGPEDWQLLFATSGSEALELLGEQPFDVIVSDMRMPNMSGVELLSEVMEKYPRTARIILSGYADQELVLRSLGATHQYLQKPFSAATLQNTITRILALDRFLIGSKVRDVVSQIKSLPTLPDMYFQLMRELASANATTDSIGQIIAQDASLTAKLLQLVNSAFFGLARPVASAVESVQILGISTIKTLAVSICVFSRFESAKFPSIPFEQIWRHSLSTGLLARQVASSESRDPALIETAFTGGVLHDIGKLILGISLPEQYEEALTTAAHKRTPSWRAERDVLGASHAEVGAYLLGLWGLPHPIVETVAWHHQPQERHPIEFCAVTAVHVADYLELCHATEAKRSPVELDETYIASLDLCSRLREWGNARG